MLQNWHLVAKNESAFSFRPMQKLMVHFKRDISPSEVHFGVNTIMTAILKGRSKPKCLKLATSKGPSE